mgnify:CR=1 FL=1
MCFEYFRTKGVGIGTIRRIEAKMINIKMINIKMINIEMINIKIKMINTRMTRKGAEKTDTEIETEKGRVDKSPDVAE